MINYTYTLNSDSSGYIITAASSTDSSIVEACQIPSEYDNLPVVAINCTLPRNIGSLEVPSSILTIGNNLCYNGVYNTYAHLTSVIFNEGLLSIGYNLFGYCPCLTEITLPNSLTTITTSSSGSIIHDCENLTTITIGSSVTDFIGDGSFINGCGSLQTINFNCINMNDRSSSIRYPFIYNSTTAGTEFNIGSQVTKIPAYLFSCGYSYDYSIKIINFNSDSVCTTLGTRCFYALKSLKEINFSDSIQTIGQDVLYDNKVKYLTLPNGLTSLHKYAFRYSGPFIQVTIPATITFTIDSNAFPYNNIELINYSTTSVIKNISSHFKSVCTSSAASLIVDSGTEVVYNGKILLEYKGTAETYTLPSNITELYKDCFENALTLKHFIVNELNVMPTTETLFSQDIDHLESFTYNGATNIPDYCTIIRGQMLVQTINLKNSTATFIGNFITNITRNGFYVKYTALTQIVLPDTVEQVGSGFFMDVDTTSSGLVSLDLTNTKLKSIAVSMFSAANYGRFKIEELKLPDTVTTIGNCAFNTCYALRRVNSEIDGVFNLPAAVTTIGEQAFYYCKKLTHISLPSNITVLNMQTFASCSALTNIVIPSGVKTINNTVFSDCSSLESITLPEGLTSLGAYVFKNCTSLQTISIPENITEINNSLFLGCSALQNVEFKGAISKFGNQVFYNCTALNTIRIPDSLTSIGVEVFKNCSLLDTIKFDSNAKFFSGILSNLDINPMTTAHNIYINNKLVSEQLDIPKEVTTLSSNTIIGPGFNKVTLSDKVTSIATNAFNNCENLTEITFEDSASKFRNIISEGWNNTDATVYTKEYKKIPVYKHETLQEF